MRSLNSTVQQPSNPVQYNIASGSGQQQLTDIENPHRPQTSSPASRPNQGGAARELALIYARERPVSIETSSGSGAASSDNIATRVSEPTSMQA